MRGERAPDGDGGASQMPEALPEPETPTLGPHPVPSPEEPRAELPVSTRIAARDLIIFQIKLALDGLGDLVLAPISLIAFVLDLIAGNKERRIFYSVLRAGERWDRWLSLYRPAKEARGTSEGLLGASKIGADTFLGKVEEVVTSQTRRSGKGRKQGGSG
ncbi:MAG: hypothetical protein HKN73_19935 [Gemmatimonadetes bacterium]|nr:hypothetical protein [Gemmatimonadota bacterium]